MASFQGKIDWKRSRKGENKNYRSVPFRSYTTRNRKFEKNGKKIQKIKKYQYGFISKQYRLGKGREREKIKIIVTFRSYTTRNTKFQKNSKKIKKIKNTIMASFQAKTGWKRLKERK